MTRDSNNEKSKNFLFNQPLSDKKTLMYIACREAKYSIVKFMLEKHFDPHIRSQLNDKETESCLQVASRWGMLDIVKLLLEKVEFQEGEIKETLEMEGLSKHIRRVLTQYYSDKFHKNEGCFMCFDFK
jgi:ankyrin repeat protein